MISSLILCCLVLFTASKAYKLNFDLNIKEGNARFVEVIRTDLQHNTVLYDVPGHNNVYHTISLQDFKSGLQIICFPVLKQCRLREIEKDLIPNAGNLTESIVHSWNEGINSISEKDSKLVMEYYYPDSKIIDTDILGEDLKDFYNNFNYPLYKETKVPDGAIFLNMSEERGLRRTKRALQTISNDCNGEAFKTVYGVETGASCNYMKICSDRGQVNGIWVFRDCNNVHITSPLVYRCQCCPAATTVSIDSNQCECEKLQD